MHDFGHKMDYLARMMLPGIATCLLFILIQLPVGVAGLSHFIPHICLISIYYWSVYHPASMPYWFIFVLGIFVDAMFHLPIGLSSLIFLICRFLILMQQRFLARETFFATWLGFAMILFSLLLLQWIVMGLFSQQIVPFTPVIMQWCMTVGLYPLTHLLFSRLYKHLPAATGKASDWGI